MKQKGDYTGWYARVEGPDGAGKSLLLANAKAYAEKHNIPAIFVREPGTGTFGEEIRNFLLHKTEHDFSPQTEYALFTASRTHLVSDVILPALREGKIVISDRGIESSVAMQGGKAGQLVAKQKGHTESLSAKLILDIGHSLLPKFYMKPNGLVLFSLSHKTRRERMNNKATSNGLDKIESRTLEYSDAVHDTYIELESILEHATVIDAEQSPEALFTQARPLLFGPEHA